MTDAREPEVVESNEIVPEEVETKNEVVPANKNEINVYDNSEELFGVFVESLKRNNRKIRDDRATAIAEDTQLVYKRAIEDVEISIKRMKREQYNMLDLSPTNTQSLTLAIDFDCDNFVKSDVEIGIKIRNAEIKLEIARNRYNYLFGSM